MLRPLHLSKRAFNGRSPGPRLTEINRRKHLRIRNHRSLAVPRAAPCVPACRSSICNEPLMPVFMVFFIWVIGWQRTFFRSPPIRPSLGCAQRSLSLAESAAQLGQRNVLQLPNTFPDNAEIFTDGPTPPLLRIWGIFPYRYRDDGRSLFSRYKR
jgi:hypothetical protein